jgi:NitT/TauT family transport system substrate-binding protein
VLTVREELIKAERARVQQLVNYILSTGLWLEASPANRLLAAEVAATPRFFNQKADLLKFVVSSPPDRVTYGDLRLVRAEFEEMMQLALEAGIITRPVAYEKYVDETFVRNFKPVDISVQR